VLIGGTGAAAAPGAKVPDSAMLYLTGAKFSSPQPVDLKKGAPKDLAWSPTGGVLYFVLDGTQIWKIGPDKTPQEFAEGPPKMSLKAMPQK
jgi:hypothetical protein